MTNAVPDDRRHHSRIAFHTPAQLVIGDLTLPVQVLDISFKGALIQLSSAPPPQTLATGHPCQLHVSLDGLDDGIRMEAHVAHAHDNRAGLLCKTIDLDSITHLRRLVELNLGDPALLERELSALVAD